MAGEGSQAEGVATLRRCVQQAEGVFPTESPGHTSTLPNHMEVLASGLQRTGDLVGARDQLHAAIRLRSVTPPPQHTHPPPPLPPSLDLMGARDQLHAANRLRSEPPPPLPPIGPDGGQRPTPCRHRAHSSTPPPPVARLSSTFVDGQAIITKPSLHT